MVGENFVSGLSAGPAHSNTDIAYAAREFIPSVISAVVIDELIRNGVKWFVYCPGSRNGPLGFELARRARAGEIDFQVRLDERSASFVALGITKASGRPTAVVTTSGTAVSNLLPAVTEANYSDLPLLLVTANRPPEVLGTGASQTVEQTALLASQTRHVQQLWSGDTLGSEANGVLRSQVCRTLGIGTGRLLGRPGPVQIDVPLSSGLPPNGEVTTPPGRSEGAPWIRMPDFSRATRTGGDEIDLRRPTLVIAGDGADRAALPPRMPVMAEPTVDIGDRKRLHPWVLDYVDPEQVVIYGRPTLHRNVGRLLARPQVRTVLAGGPGDWVYAAPDIEILSGNPVFRGEAAPAWVEELELTDGIVRGQWTRLLNETSTRRIGLGVASAVLGGLRDGDALWLGASNPIRDVSLAGVVPAGVRVLSNRGVAGIDGNVSAAVGAALSAPDRTVVALLGDLTFAHDASGLQFGHLEQVPGNLIIVVSNDSGGGIFELLEQGDARYRQEPYGDTFERIYGTPQRVDIAALCGAYGVAHRRVELEDLGVTLRQERFAQRLSVLEISVARTALRGVHATARRAVDAALAAAPGPDTTPDADAALELELRAPELSGNLEYS
ncbi:2-succinyl-5-enolpyruvyl-6-hydroxy-3-cyclohexene-1-carboxylic-acid synthase [Nocardia seriolae]|nr:2-succinyl-5-enolpyruvyl-6-hydroxy-3-cyclohexene-1-carboxylic-acid synthase [Nocardia seriolae]QOW34906.1 2-succinyl-5-enolpyruvyl-6-hydroxy-3-cyclohexene-1-carboxylic-acid synthase [Nocardia seriolae]QUN17631.1 2-succinyl-5-enolpyruvyl-6-hydroxy-3-cyclohexene-1-carboxylic-acid synthase [Nocardia seriolae]